MPPGEVDRPVAAIAIVLRPLLAALRRLAVDRHQLAGAERLDRRIGDTERAQGAEHLLGLIGLDVHQEVVRRVRRQPVAPLPEQAGADHRQQQQGAQRQRQAHELHHAQCAAPGQRRQAQFPRPAQLSLQPPQYRQQHRADRRGQGRQQGQAAQHPGCQHAVAGGVDRQHHGGDQGRGVHQQRGRRQCGEAAVEHAHRRDVAQAQQRRQAEAEQQQQADAGAGQGRGCLRQRQAVGNQAAQRFDQADLGQHAQAHAERAGGDRQQQQLHRQRTEDVALARAQAAQHGHVVDAAQGEAVGGQRGGDAGQQHRQQRGQRQEASGAVEGAAHATLGVLDADQAVGLGAWRQPFAQGGDLAGRAGEHQSIRSAAAGAEQAGGIDVGAVDQQWRRQLHQLAGGIRFGAQHAGHAQRAGAELQRIAELQPQRFEQARIGIGFAARRRTGAFAAGADGVARDQQRAAQRVARAHRLDVGHLAGVAMEQHAGKTDHARAAQAAPLRLLGEGGRNVLAPADAEVAADHLGGAAGQRQGHPVDQGADRGHHRHAQHQRGEHGQQIAGEQLAAQCARGMAQYVHAASAASAARRRPPSSR
ncbi:hypothetical protein NB723_001847 [Xanthomonas sacchari]|nr:hypothetical protein [Xanthomonas sacchari]